MNKRYSKTVVRGFIHLEREEMLKHKWIESEKVGYDLGEKALIDWAEKHSKNFRKLHLEEVQP